MLEDEKDSSNHEASEELNAEANMFVSEDASPEEDEPSLGTDSPSNNGDSATFEDSTPFEEEVTQWLSLKVLKNDYKRTIFLKDDNNIEVEDFTGSNDDGEDLLLEKLSQHAKQEFEEAKEYIDKDDEPEFSREYIIQDTIFRTESNEWMNLKYLLFNFRDCSYQKYEKSRKKFNSMTYKMEMFLESNNP